MSCDPCLVLGMSMGCGLAMLLRFSEHFKRPRPRAEDPQRVAHAQRGKLVRMMGQAIVPALSAGSRQPLL
jgi:hypothetical protein